MKVAMLILFVYVLVAMGLSAQSPNSDDEKQNPFSGSPKAIEAGGQTFVETCSACHGVNGEGGRGPSLVGRFVRRLSDQQLFNSVQKGVPGTDMPPLPWPDFYGGFRKGDNLYSDSVVALDADSGEMKWYFQFTPHDTHDWDANETPVLLDAEFQGKQRKLMI